MTTKKQKNFRLHAEIDAELKRRSEITGIPETRIVEDALRNHFAESMGREMLDALNKITKHGVQVTPLVPLMVTMALGRTERDNDRAGDGAVAQLVEHFAGSEKVEDASSSCSTPARQSVRKGTSNGQDVLPGLPGSTGIQASAGRYLRRKQSCPN